MKLLITILILLTFITTGSAATYYVDNTGGNNGYDGSFSTPWNNVYYAVDQLSPGDTLYIRAGTYVGTDFSVDGSPGNYITVENYNSENVYFTSKFEFVDDSYWHVKGLVFNTMNTPFKLLETGTHHIIIEDCSMSVDSGMIIDSAHDITFRNCVIHHTGYGYANCINIYGCDPDSEICGGEGEACDDNSGRTSNLFFIDVDFTGYCDHGVFNPWTIEEKKEYNLIDGVTFLNVTSQANCGNFKTNWCVLYNLTITNYTIYNGYQGFATTAINAYIKDVNVYNVGTHASIHIRGDDSRSSNVTLENVHAHDPVGSASAYPGAFTEWRSKDVTFVGDCLSPDFNYDIGFKTEGGDYTQQKVVDMVTGTRIRGAYYGTMTSRQTEGNIYTIAGGSSSSILYTHRGSEIVQTWTTGTTMIPTITEKGGKPSEDTLTSLLLSGNNIEIEEDLSSYYSGAYWIRAINDVDAATVNYDLDFGATPSRQLYVYRNGEYYTEFTTDSNDQIDWEYTGGFSGVSYIAIEFNTDNESFYTEGEAPPESPGNAIGNVSGHIYTTGSIVLVSDTVKLFYTNNTLCNTTTTDSSGYYNFTDESATNYYIFAKWTGYDSNQSDSFIITDGGDIEQDLTLDYSEIISINVSHSIDLDDFNWDITPTSYSCNRTDLFTDFSTSTGTGNWIPDTAEIVNIKFGVSDGAITTNRTIKYTVPAISYLILNVDSYRLKSSDPSTVFDNSEFIDIGNLNSALYRNVLSFNISSIPLNADIINATLKIYWYYNFTDQSTVVDIYRPYSWDEDYVCWNNKDAGEEWNAYGGDWYDFNGDVNGAVAFNSSTFSGSPDNQYREFNVIDLISMYINGTWANNGILLKSHNETANDYIAFKSSISSENKPTLTIYYQQEDIGENNISLSANQYGLLRKDTNINQTLNTISGTIDNDQAYTWYNSTSDMWESYWVGYSYNEDCIIPKHDSYFVSVTDVSVIDPDVTTAETVVIPSEWYMTYLRGSTNQTLTDIKTDMGGNVDDLYAWDVSAQDWTDTGSFVVNPNEGLFVNSSTGFNWDGSI